MSVTIKDVARAAGVSVATVSRVLNGTANVSEATHQKVMDAVKADPDPKKGFIIYHKCRKCGEIFLRRT